MAVSDRSWDRLISTEVGNREHRLYGGAQYHRAMREFNLATRCLRVPTITEDEIANAAGIGDTHDGVNFLRAACVIALEKARSSFDPLLESMRIRLTHIMAKACPVSEYILVQKKERNSSLYSANEKLNRIGDSKRLNSSSDISQNPQFRQLVRTIYEKFVQKCSESVCCVKKRNFFYSLLANITRILTCTAFEDYGAMPGRSHSTYEVRHMGFAREKQWCP
jgi:hypothetical protein